MKELVLQVCFFLCLSYCGLILGFPCLSELRHNNIDDKRNVLSNVQLWPASKSPGERQIIVPYTVKTTWSWGGKEKTLMRTVAETLKKYTCIVLKERTNEPDYIEVHKGSGCHSSIGRIGKKQDLSLGNNCDNYRTVMHEVVHALGFVHEQNRPDRDQHVRILWDNIKEGAKSQFEKFTSMSYFGQPYDFKSIMHYKRNGFSKNGKPTIEAIEDPNMSLGGERLSITDIMKLNIAYQCPQQRKLLADYEITVYTGSSHGAGTDAKVYIDLFESEGSNAGEVELVGGSFENGNVDRFDKILPSFARLYQIIIRHDGSGYFSPWKLDKVVVKNKKTNQVNTFSCNCWIYGNKPKTLKPSR